PVLLGTIKTDRPLKVMSENWGPLLYIVLEPKEQIVERRYALRLFENKPMQKHLAQLGNGILQHRAAIKWDDIKPQAVPVPPLEEQRAILYFLDRETQRIDSLIEEKQTFIKLLKEKRQALISHVVTKGLNPNVEMQDSGIEWIGQVPKHWVIRRLKHTSTLQSGIAKGKDNGNKETLSVPMLRVANVQDGYVKLDDVHEINVLPHEVERYALKDGDVLMNEGGDNDKLGRGTVWKEQIKPCIHQNHVFVIRVTDIEPEWLGWLTQSAYAKFYFFRVSKQSTNLASISSTNVKEVHLLIPPADERKIIMEYLEKQTSKLKLLIQDVEESITLLKEHRTSLISAAVTGKIDVREAV
ncbi:restriction endonuclease subunit S, partial [Vibrio cholerae]|uniref:restriction endonuclease subunit S n=1 Tax=Vibrio cholerae TaxID=666 RepID=UPI0011D70D75